MKNLVKAEIKTISEDSPHYFAFEVGVASSFPAQRLMELQEHIRKRAYTDFR